MALFKVKVTKKESGEEVEYRLYEWNPSMFQTNATLKLITSDYQSVKTDFNDIEKLDIYAGENFLAAFTAYDSFSSAMAFSSQFYEPESRFVDVIEINLTKADLVNQVQKLDAKINPVVNPDVMDLEEYKTYIHEQVSQSAQADIFNGQDIVMSDGSTGHFTFTLEDQSNTASAMASVRELLGQGVPIEQLSVPYHSSGNPCEMFSVVDFTNIYTTLYLHSTYVQTYCNAINMLIKVCESKEELTKITYGMELPEESMNRVNEIVASSKAFMMKIVEPYLPKTDTDTTGKDESSKDDTTKDNVNTDSSTESSSETKNN